ncbi:ribosome assembly protein 3 [Candida albicans L26]|uniref:Ribosome assembly protein 3 n=2 Tax=Candida albicans TaxID=5476 RepID=RSA3_CANAL|nr:uncharacterized protein CAALFM_C104710CA [Candida albicans SC5314]Q59VF9.2 RecName: Full=Ribosome assembly protein 3 [Candida albicans SC5314]KAF6063282.1 Ribosome-assembly protein 3 family protein [Candida albicans]KGQ98861.1 ribosome assembly protein 3 [Candida albicans P37005]KGR23524.1 ribosome assembly protein 3 [Candida albicans P37037]KGT72659.1 ribosome assembly protein 3 [Candida albicans 12C]KGU18720.1 ribosome assembly protein 3 [Candida albicans L26]KGU19492.1 ribosome assembl|eukprot:XP_713583.2 hypothetical protein CAALFM_C104710CA [Candida albicans SC5314]
MAASDAHNNNKKRSNRRRKKRRTEDFSSSSESSSSSSSESDHEDLDEPEKEISKQDINIDDIDIESDNENSALTNDKGNKLIPQNLSITEKQQLSTVPFTTTSISNITNDNQIKNTPNINEISKNLDQKKTQLNNEFLKIMTTEFGDDLDELRKKPDFTEKSLVILAKTLQSGVNMFDIDVLNGLIQESGNTSNQ